MACFVVILTQSLVIDCIFLLLLLMMLVAEMKHFAKRWNNADTRTNCIETV